MKNFIRIANLEAPEGSEAEAMWFCEDCVDEWLNTGDYEFLEEREDDLGDIECEGCNLHFDHEDMEYVK